jgi:uncharacterized protein with HEPN domain
MPREDATLLDIVNAARLIQTFTQDMTQEAFLSDLKTQSAVLHQITVIGEAVKRLSQAFRERHPILPWSLMARMRDHLIHGYDATDLDEVWKTATPPVIRLRCASRSSHSCLGDQASDHKSGVVPQC